MILSKAAAPEEDTDPADHDRDDGPLLVRGKPTLLHGPHEVANKTLSGKQLLQLWRILHLESSAKQGNSFNESGQTSFFLGGERQEDLLVLVQQHSNLQLPLLHGSLVQDLN